MTTSTKDAIAIVRKCAAESLSTGENWQSNALFALVSRGFGTHEAQNAVRLVEEYARKR